MVLAKYTANIRILFVYSGKNMMITDIQSRKRYRVADFT